MDAIAQVTGERPFFPRAPKAARAQEIHDEDGGAYSLRALGRCPRDGSIDPSSPPSPTISMALHLIHGPLASEWLSAPGGRIAALTKNPQPPGKIADQLFLVSLGRLPSADERRRAIEALGAEATPERVEDLLWSLLASTEFSMNH